VRALDAQIAAADVLGASRPLVVRLDLAAWDGAELSAGSLELHLEAVVPYAAPADLSERVAAAHAAGVELTATVRVLPTQAAQAGATVTALRRAGVHALRVEPVAVRGWDGAACKALATSLFQAAGALRGARWLDASADLGPEAELALDAHGWIGRADGLDREALRPEARIAELRQRTNLDRHFFDLADPAALPGMPTLDAAAKLRQPAEKVLKSFAGWLAGTAEARPAEAAAADGVVS
jgi:hypothetical protein